MYECGATKYVTIDVIAPRLIARDDRQGRERGVARHERLRAADRARGDPRRSGPLSGRRRPPGRPASRSRRWCRRWKTCQASQGSVWRVGELPGQPLPRPPTLTYFTAMMTVFSNASPMLSDDTDSTSATARWTMRRSYGLSGPISCARPVSLAFPQETSPSASARHLCLCGSPCSRRRVAGLRTFVAEDGRDDVLQRGQRLALPANQHRPSSPVRLMRSPSGISSAGLELEAHRGDDLLDERGDFGRCGHIASQSLSVPSAALFSRTLCAGGPIR